MAAIARKTRTTTSVTFSLDTDALSLTEAMLGGGRVGIGRLVSELLRREARERVQRAQWVQALERQADVERALG